MFLCQSLVPLKVRSMASSFFRSRCSISSVMASRPLSRSSFLSRSVLLCSVKLINWSFAFLFTWLRESKKAPEWIETQVHESTITCRLPKLFQHFGHFFEIFHQFFNAHIFKPEKKAKKKLVQGQFFSGGFILVAFIEERGRERSKRTDLLKASFSFLECDSPKNENREE